MGIVLGFVIAAWVLATNREDERRRIDVMVSKAVDEVMREIDNEMMMCLSFRNEGR